MSIEHDLHRALRRRPAPPDLADRVLTRLSDNAESGVGRTVVASGFRRTRVWLAAAAAIALMVTGGARYYTQQQTIAEAERVKQEIRLALQITGEKLALAQQRVERSAVE